MRPLSRTLLAFALLLVALFASDARASWPPAPGADMKDPANWPNDYQQRWNYLSYIPTRSAKAPPLAPEDAALGAAGMSVDEAWTYTIGRDDVKIFITDSGIEWEQADLVNKVALNAAELKGDKQPKDAAGAVCGGSGVLAGYDCNGDGVFDVSDYRDDPRISPVVTGDKCFSDPDRVMPGTTDRIKGDVNRNCILDPGDLIEMFSDGVDDDANGYTDDIAGWDFFKDDNNPYDDTRYGHGTGEAKDSGAQANNGKGTDEPGTCPNCRFVPLRVGNSFIADANDFGQAVIYATDNGAKVIQEALGTLDNTDFSRAAIDYAYSKGAIVMASMADENSRHHNQPATSNHVLTVHSIRYDNDIPSATTFIAFDTCSNYGGHLSLSISATSCSSEATGRSSGIAGLAMSMGLQEGLTLSAEEVMQLFKTNADDIDVARSRMPDAKVYFSQPGFDQRFGYGRANAARMMAAIKAHLIPPEVEIVSPEWFAPIFADRTSTVEIKGRVAASRAKTYDYRVQWAAGVQPLDADYKDLVAPLVNVPSSTVSGGVVALGQLDPRQVDTTHVQDDDSPMGENDRTISIRVRAIAHYDSGDVAGEARRVISVTNDKNGLDRDLLPGFPVRLSGSGEASSKLADIDGDGVREIITPDSGGKLHVMAMHADGPAELPGFPYVARLIDGLDNGASAEPTVPSYLAGPAYKAGAQGGVDPNLAHEAILAAPAVADLDGDGRQEIVFTTWAGTIYVINAKGEDLPGWPKRLPLVPSCPLDTSKTAPATCMDAQHDFARGSYSAPVITDMTGDGKPEIVISAFDGNIYVFKLDGTMAPGFPVAVKSTLSDRLSRIMSTPTVGDLNGDGLPEIVTGSNQQLGGGGGAGGVFVIDGRGNAAPGGPYLPNWPIVMTSLKLFPVVAEGIVASQAMADFDGDGRPEVVTQGNGSRPLALAVDPGVQKSLSDDPPNRFPIATDEDGNPTRGLEATSIFGENTKAAPDVFFPLFSQPSVGDLDQDGVPDIITSGASLSLAGSLASGDGIKGARGQQLLAFWSGKTGRMFPGSPVLIEDYTFLVNHTVADVSGDAYPEVITGTGGYFLHAVDACGREAPGFPKFTNGWIAATAAVGDIDGDASKGLEVVSSTRDGWLFAWHTKGVATGPVQWESFHHDNANTGNYAVKLDQGTTQLAATPIDCSEPVVAPPDRFDAGGCGCKTAGGGSSSPGNGDAGLACLACLALMACSRRARGTRCSRRRSAR